MIFELEEKIRMIAAPLLSELLLEIVEMQIRPQGKSLVIEILVDKPGGGVTIQECAILNRRIGNALEAENVIAGQYLLEVSSPGLDRPLKTRSDFSRGLHKEIKFFLTEPIEEQWEYLGKIVKVSDEEVVIEVKGRQTLLPFSKINKAKHNINIGRI